MLGKTHVVTGLAAGLVFAHGAHLIDTTPLVAYAVAAGAALLPDLDQPASLATRTMATKPAHLLLRNFSHRGFTHSIPATVLFALACLGLKQLGKLNGIPILDAYIIMAVVGYASHIVADMFNKNGVWLFYPFSPFGKRYWNVPLPWSLRIATKYDPHINLLDPRSIQSVIHTERLFWMFPMVAVIALVVYLDAATLASVARQAMVTILSTPPNG